jgi:hypothetical protein
VLLINSSILRVITMVVRKIDQENDGRLNHGFFKVVMHIACTSEVSLIPLSLGTLLYKQSGLDHQ